MISTPIEEARRSLELSVDAILRIADLKSTTASLTAGRALLDGLLRLVRTVDGNLHLSRARGDCQAEYEHEWSALVQRRGAPLAALKQLRADAALAFPVVSGPLPAHLASHPFSDEYSLLHVDSLLTAFEGAADPDGEDSEPDESDGCVAPARALQTILREALPQMGVPTNDPSLKQLVRDLGEIHDELLRIRRSFLLLRSVHPANEIAWLQDVAHKCNPERGSVDWILSGVTQKPADIAGLRALQFDLRSVDLIWFEHFRTKAVANAIAIHSELHSRLGTRASAVWLLQRYAQRCRWLRRAEIQTGTGIKAGRQQEIDLTRDAALYLFDQGLDVLTEQSLGQQRYDILGTSLLVEAKIFTRERPALKAIADGLRQIHNYHTTLSQEGFTSDPVLVVFRLSGRHADIPPEARIGNLLVSLVYVDLGGSAESGSRALMPEVLTAETIVAEVNAVG